MTAATVPREEWALGHRPALDGLRGVAVLLVLLWHAQLPLGHGGGWLGVTAFFVLSGFLITRLLLEEHRATGRIGITAFYGRRVRRLAPALLAVILVVSVARLSVGASAETVAAQAAVVLAYLSNWAIIGSADLGGYGHAWTLAIEEQFYLVWPAVVALLARWPRHVFGAALVVGIITSIAIRFSSDGLRASMGADARMDALLIGAGAALLVGHVRPPRFALVAAAALIVVLMQVEPHPFGTPISVTIAAPLIALIILGTLEHPYRLSARWLRGVGRISYGLYLWHYGPLLLLLPTTMSWPWILRGMFLFSVWFAIAIASWYLVERPFLASRAARRAEPKP